MMFMTRPLRTATPSVNSILRHHVAPRAKLPRTAALRVAVASPTTQRAMFATCQKRDQAKTFSNQAKLPRLPVPDLDKSLEGYLKSLIPVLEQKVSSITPKKKLTKARSQ